MGKTKNITFEIFSQCEFFKTRTVLWNPILDIELKIKSNLCIHCHLVPTVGKSEPDIISDILLKQETNLNFSQPAISFLKFLGALSGIQTLSEGFPGQQSSYSCASWLSTRSFFFPQYGQAKFILINRVEISVGNFPTSPNPVHGTAALGESLKCWDPLHIRNIAISVSQQSAGVVVPGLNEPVGRLDEVLVISVVEQVASSHRPHVFEQGVRGMHPPW